MLRHSPCFQPNRKDLRSANPFDMFSVPSASWLKIYPAVSFEKLSSVTLKVRFEGDTWSFRSRFNAVGIPGRYEDSDGMVIPSTADDAEKKNASYVRIIKSINVEEPTSCAFLKKIFGDTVYKGTMVKVTWTGNCTEDEAVHGVMTTLKSIPNVCQQVQA